MNNSRDEKRMQEFGDYIRKLREDRGLTLQAMADKVYIEKSQIHRIEHAKINATLTTILLLAEALDLHPSELFKYLP